MAITARYRAHPKYEDIVVNATGELPAARSAAQNVAEQVAATAKANVSALTLTGRGAQQAQAAVAAEIGVLPVESFRRKQRHKGTLIPVALVVADHPMSKWFEYGHGRSFPLTRFLRSAGMVGARLGATFKARGRR